MIPKVYLYTLASFWQSFQRPSTMLPTAGIWFNAAERDEYLARCAPRIQLTPGTGDVLAEARRVCQTQAEQERQTLLEALA